MDQIRVKINLVGGSNQVQPFFPPHCSNNPVKEQLGILFVRNPGKGVARVPTPEHRTGRRGRRDSGKESI